VTLPVLCFVSVVVGPAELVTVVIVVVFGAADVEVEEELLLDVFAADEELLLVVGLEDDEELLEEEEEEEDDVVVAGVEDLVDEDDDDEDEAAEEDVLVVSFTELDEDVLEEVPLLPFPFPLFPSPLPLLARLAFLARRLLCSSLTPGYNDCEAEAAASDAGSARACRGRRALPARAGIGCCCGVELRCDTVKKKTKRVMLM